MSEPQAVLVKFQAHPDLKYGVWGDKYSAKPVLLAICSCPVLAEQIAKLAMDGQKFKECNVSPIAIRNDMDIWPRNDEELELGQAALRWLFETIRAARARGKYAAFSWMNETQQNQMEHAFEHCRADLRELLHPSSVLLESRKDHAQDEPHAAHALCRLAILAALQERKPKN